MIKAVIFDKDGVLVDSEPLQYESTKQILQEYGFSYTLDDNKTLSLGRSGTYTYAMLVQKYKIENIDIFKQKRREKYRELVKTQLKMRNGVIELIRKLKKLNFSLAVASGSSKDLLMYDLDKFKLTKYFAVITSGENYQSKPDPEIFLVTAEKLKTDPTQCAVIEDSQAGVEAAKTAGMYCLAIPNNFTNYQDFSKADLVCNTFDSVYNNIMSKNKDK